MEVLAPNGLVTGGQVEGRVGPRFRLARSSKILRTSMWWALQTVTTVGCGHAVPTQTGWRVIGVVLDDARDRGDHRGRSSKAGFA